MTLLEAVKAELARRERERLECKHLNQLAELKNEEWVPRVAQKIIDQAREGRKV